MTTLIFWQNAAGKQAILTDEHAACSYGQPVLLIDGIAHGAGDIVDNGFFAPSLAADERYGYAGTRILETEEIALFKKWYRACGNVRKNTADEKYFLAQA